MLRTLQLACGLPKTEADALNRASGQVYSRTLVFHYRVYRRKGIWLSPAAQSRLEDALGGPTILHARSRDVAQQAFPKACKAAKAARTAGLDARYPHTRKYFRTTTGKHTGIRLREGQLLLSRARGLFPIAVALPAHLASLPVSAFRQVELVWDRASKRYHWHLTLEDGKAPAPHPGEGVAAVDLGELHPAAVTDGTHAVVISLRALRAARQGTAKRLASLASVQARKQRGSKAWRRLARRRSRFLAQQKRRTRDLEHKASRAVVTWAVEHGVGTLVIGDVRNVARGKRLHRKSQQKIGLWSHGQQREYIQYKAEAAGITVPALVDEHYTSQTCPRCQQRHKPRGRRFRCPGCGLQAHRDIVGATNILSRFRCGAVGQLLPPAETTYRHPFSLRAGKRSRLDTAHVAGGSLPEAAGL